MCFQVDDQRCCDTMTFCCCHTESRIHCHTHTDRRRKTHKNREEGKGKPPRLYPKTGYLWKDIYDIEDIQHLLKKRAEHQNNNNSSKFLINVNFNLVTNYTHILQRSNRTPWSVVCMQTFSHFLHRRQMHCLSQCLTMHRDKHPKLTLPTGGSGPAYHTWFLRHTPVINQKASWLV